MSQENVCEPGLKNGGVREDIIYSLEMQTVENRLLD